MGIMTVQTPGPETRPDAATPGHGPSQLVLYMYIVLAETVRAPGPTPNNTVLFYAVWEGPLCRCHPVTVCCHLLSPPSASYMSHLLALAIVFATANFRTWATVVPVFVTCVISKLEHLITCYG